MSKTLDTLVDRFLKLQDTKVFQENVEESAREVYVNATKEKIKKEIYNEIENELIDKVTLKVEHTIDEKAGIRRINEFKKLVIDGFIVAIFVGLFVNQVTEVIGYYKGVIDLNSIWPTIFIALILISICILIFGYLFVSEFINLLNKEKKDEED